jgi:serine phosphatase RsbU (regulator of sigma subunit)
MKRDFLGFIIFSLLGFNASAQEYADPEFYLIDSLILDDLTSYDLELIDTSLIHYHNTTNDTIELGILEHIVDNCWHPKYWPKYNVYLINQIEQKLTIKQDEAVLNKELYYLAGAISNVGYFYDESGELALAMDYYHESLKLYERLGNLQGAATTFNNLGVMYSVIGDTTRALEYHFKSLEYKKKLRDKKGVSMSFNNIGTIYENAKDYYGALEFYEASLSLRIEINDLRGIAMSYDNIGDIYYREEVYSKANQYYLKSYAIWNDLGIETGIASSLNNLAKLNFKLGDYSKAKEYGLKGYEIATRLNFPVDIENSSRTLIDISEQGKDYKSAFEYAMIFIATRDKLRGEKSAEISLKKSMRYQYQKLALKDSLQHQQEKEVQQLQIKKQKSQAYALYIGIGFLFIIIFVVARSYRRKQEDNLKINEQKIKVENQKKEIELSHIALEVTHQEISDSISYAKRIQEAILPEKEHLKLILEDSFVFYQPKDVVSGDFYWLVEKDDFTLFAVADCTGHGVPGAMVSVVCHNALNRVVREFNIIEPAKILDKTREIVIETFKAKEGVVKDGMDISICSHNKKKNEVQWAGAYNPLYYIKNGSKEVEMVIPDKQPVGPFIRSKNFTNHTLHLSKGDLLYLFTDGYVDQFGLSKSIKTKAEEIINDPSASGEEKKSAQNALLKGRKFKHGQFKELLYRIKDEKMEEQGIEMKRVFLEWSESFSQIDDVCVIGVRI